MSLADLVRQQAERRPEATAVVAPDGTLTYQQLDALSNRVARALVALGVRAGDRVGIWLRKSTRAVAAMQGVLRAGAAYVPIEPDGPVLRALRILAHCRVRAVITDPARTLELAALAHAPEVAVVGAAAPHARGFDASLDWDEVDALPATPPDLPGMARVDDQQLAYILYTSGTTGMPKGVCLSHGNALAFVAWAARAVALGPDDRLSSHAPFHFDLSVFDLYAAFHAGAAVHLVPEGSSYVAQALVDFLHTERISVWYSVPAAWILMMEHADLLARPSPPALRAILFAGEVFPIDHLRRLYRHCSHARFFNWYGPTETNVCMSYEVTHIADDRRQPVPIGQACCGDSVVVVDAHGAPVAPGQEGELLVSGPTVMLGYWGQPARGHAPYPTGDIVRRDEDGNYVYVGRRDHMVKVRGYRVELGEVEAALAAHPAVREVAVAFAGAGHTARLVAFLALRPGERLSLLAAKAHCAKHLPRYMIIDRLRIVDALPRTRNGKIDRAALGAGASPVTH